MMICTCSEIAEHNAIRIHHRHYLKYCHLQKLNYRFTVLLNQTAHETLHNQRCHSLARMHSGRHQHHFLTLCLRLPIGNGDQGESQASETIPQQLHLHIFSTLGLQTLNKVQHLGVGVGWQHGHCILGILFQVQSEGQLVNSTMGYFGVAVLGYGDIGARGLPFLIHPIALFYEYSLSFLYQLELSLYIAHVEPIASIAVVFIVATNLQFKIEPILMPMCVSINSQIQIILVLTHLRHQLQVSTLDLVIKGQGFPFFVRVFGLRTFFRRYE